MNKFFTFLFIIIAAILFSAKTQAQTDTMVLQPGPGDGYHSDVRSDLPFFVHFTSDWQ